MKRQVLVVGLGRFGSSVAAKLYERGHDVMAIDENERRVQDINSVVTYAVQADATNEASLRELGVTNFDLAVIATGTEIQSSVLATVLLKRMGLPYVVARAENELHGLTLEKIGADMVIYPEREAGERLAHNLAYSGVIDYLQVTSGFGVSKITPPKEFYGQTLEEADLGPRSKSGLSVLIVKRNNDVIITPDRFERIQEGDVLIVAGTDKGLENLESRAHGGASSHDKS